MQSDIIAEQRRDLLQAVDEETNTLVAALALTDDPHVSAMLRHVIDRFVDLCEQVRAA